jgi:hypothetical protein
MDFDVPNLIAALVFGCLGLMYLKHAKKAIAMRFAITGILLVVFGYFTPSVAWTIGIGVVLALTPFVMNYLP